MVTSIKVSVLSFSRGSLVAPLFLSASFCALFIAVAASQSPHHPPRCPIALHFPGCHCVGGAGMQQQQQQHVSNAG